MKTLKATGQYVYSVSTDAVPGVPKGKVHVQTVQYQNFEMDEAEFQRMNFLIHDNTLPEARRLARLVGVE